MLNFFSCVKLFAPYGLWLTRLLYPWDSPGKNTGVGCHALPPGDLPNPGIKLRSLKLQTDSFPAELRGKPTQLSHFAVLQKVTTL